MKEQLDERLVDGSRSTRSLRKREKESQQNERKTQQSENTHLFTLKLASHDFSSSTNRFDGFINIRTNTVPRFNLVRGEPRNRFFTNKDAQTVFEIVLKERKELGTLDTRASGVQERKLTSASVKHLAIAISELINRPSVP